MQINKYYISAASAFIIWGFFSLALKPLQQYPSLDILFYRIFYAAALLLVISIFFRRKVLKDDWLLFKSLDKKKRYKLLLLTISGGFLLVINWFLFIYAVNHISLKSASFAYLICPILTTILAFFILKEKLSNWQWLAVALSVISCAILSFGNGKELIFSLVIAISFAIYLVGQRKNNQFDKLVVLTVQMVIAAVAILPFFPTFGGPVPTAPLFYILLIVIVILFTIIPLFLNLYALKGMNSSAVGILMYINPIINFLIAVFYFGETVNSLQVFSYGLILLSVVIFNEQILFRKKKVKSLS